MTKFKIAKFLSISWNDYTPLWLAAQHLPLIACVWYNNVGGSTVNNVYMSAFSLFASSFALPVIIGLSGMKTEHSYIKMLNTHHQRAIKDKKNGRNSYDILAESLVVGRFSEHIKSEPELLYDFADICEPLNSLKKVPQVHEPERLRAALYKSMDSVGMTLDSIAADIYATETMSPYHNIVKKDSVLLALVEVLVCRGDKISDAILSSALAQISKYKGENLQNMVIERIVASIQYSDQLNLSILRSWISENPNIKVDALDTLDKLQPSAKKSEDSAESDFFSNMSRLFKSEVIAAWPNPELRESLTELQACLVSFKRSWPAEQLSELKSVFAPSLAQLYEYVSNVPGPETIREIEPKLEKMVRQLIDISKSVNAEQHQSIVKSVTIQEKLIDTYHKKVMTHK